MTIETYMVEADKLSTAERIELVQKLWDSIAAEEAAVPVTTSQRSELDRRVEALNTAERAGQPADQLGVDWPTVKRRIVER